MSKNVAVNVMSQEQARELFTYDDGELYWKVRPAGSSGSKAGGEANGYIKLKYQNKSYKLHNLVWNYHYGKIPAGKTIDHKDRNGLNNRIENLRPATQPQQERNKVCRGFTKRKKHTNPWEVRIQRNHKEYFVGAFPTALQARLAYEKEAGSTDPEFADLHFTEAINRLLRH